MSGCVAVGQLGVKSTHTQNVFDKSTFCILCCIAATLKLHETDGFVTRLHRLSLKCKSALSLIVKLTACSLYFNFLTVMKVVIVTK